MKNTFAFYQGAQPGVNDFGKRMIGATTGRQAAYDSTLKSLGAADKAAGEAEAKRAQAARLDAGGASLADEAGFLSNMSGLARPLTQKAMDYHRTGNVGFTQPATPVDDEGGIMPAPALDRPEDLTAAGLTPTALALVSRARQLRQATMAGKESTVDQIAKASGEFQDQGTADQVQQQIGMGDMLTASARNQARKPGEAIKLYDNVGNTGATMQLATGAVALDNPLAQATLGNVTSQTALHGAQAREADFKAQGGGADKSPNLHPIYDADGNALAFNPKTGATEPIIGPDGKPVMKRNTEKAMPASAIKTLQENQGSLRRAQQALNLISGNDVGSVHGDANATGMKGYVPDAILQRWDEPGNATRAAIADVGSLLIHDRSGAAVTASEYPRLAPFVPNSKDDPATVRTKLLRFVQEYTNIVQETQDFYRESGYKVPDVLRGADGQRAAPAGATPAAGPAPGARPPLSSFAKPGAASAGTRPADRPARATPTTNADRVQILRDELAHETAYQPKDAADAQRKQSNIDSLQRELRGLGV